MPGYHSTLNALLKYNVEQAEGSQADNLELARRMMAKLAAAATPVHRRISLPNNAHVNMLYHPQRLKINGGEHDAHLGSGVVELFMSRADGETLNVRVAVPIARREFSELTESTLQDLIGDQHPDVKAFVENGDVNSVLYKPTPGEHLSFDDMRISGMGNTPAQQSRFEWGQDQVRNEHSIVRFLADEEKQNGTFVFSVGRLFDESIYRQLGLNDEQRDTVTQELKQEYADAAFFTQEEMTTVRNARLLEAGLDLRDEGVRYNGFRIKDYPEQVLNFIAQPDDPQTRKYRLEFVQRTYLLLKGNAEPEHYPESFAPQLNALIPDAHQEEIMSMVDQGRYPAKPIATAMGLPNTTKKQFARAMQIYGVTGNVMRKEYVSGAFSVKDPKDAFAFAKIPTEWWKWNELIPDMMTHYDLGEDIVSREYVQSLNKDVSRVMPYLRNTAVAIDSLQGSGDKLAMRGLMAQWDWVKGDGRGMLFGLKAMDKKHKISASFNDYVPMLDGLLDAVMNATIYRHSGIKEEHVFTFSHGDDELSIDESELTSQIFEHEDSAYTEYFYDNPDEFEYDELMEEDLPSQQLGNLELVNSGNIRTELLRRETSFRAQAERNDDMHKAYNKFLQRANDTSPGDITWTPIVNEPIDFGEYQFVPINTRLALLEEGSRMSHCVFSYLQPCVAGESVIMSVRHKEEPDAPLATIELTPEPTTRTDEDGESYEFIELSLNQCYGRGNTTNALTQQASQAMRDWLEGVNKHGGTNINQIAGNEQGADELHDRVANDPAGEGHLLCSVPYHTDGAHMAYFMADRFLPPGVNVDSLFDTNETLMNLYYGSEFRKEIGIVQDLSRQYGIEPDAILDMKQSLGIDDFSKLPLQFGEPKRRMDAVSALVENYHGELSNEQLAKEIQGTLTREFNCEIPNLDVLERKLGWGTPDIGDLIVGVKEIEKPEMTEPANDHTPEEMVQRLKRA